MPPPHGTKTDEYCMGPSGKAAGRERSVDAGCGGGSKESAPATSSAASGSPFDKAHGGRSELATVGTGEDSDVVACLGFLPERHVGAGGETRDWDAGVEGNSQAGDTGVEGDAQRGDFGVASDGLCEGAAVVGEGGPVPPAAACDGTLAARSEEILTNEPKLDQEVTTTQNEENVEVVADSDAISGLDTLRTNPRPEGGSEGEERAKSEDEGLSSKLEIRNSKSERGRGPGDIGHEDQPVDAGRADMLSCTASAGTLTPALSRGERECGSAETLTPALSRGERECGSAGTLTPALSRGERECGSENPAVAVAGCRPRANPPPAPEAAPPRRLGRNLEEAARWEVIRQAWIKSRQQQRPEECGVTRGGEEIRVGAEIDKLASVGESTACANPPSPAAVGSLARASPPSPPGTGTFVCANASSPPEDAATEAFLGAIL